MVFRIALSTLDGDANGATKHSGMLLQLANIWTLPVRALECDSHFL
jgi:hypothetical protein